MALHLRLLVGQLVVLHFEAARARRSRLRLRTSAGRGSFEAPTPRASEHPFSDKGKSPTDIILEPLGSGEEKGTDSGQPAKWGGWGGRNKTTGNFCSQARGLLLLLLQPGPARWGSSEQGGESRFQTPQHLALGGPRRPRPASPLPTSHPTPGAQAPKLQVAKG